ncbi:hypothetical protein HK102_007522, partial [Quaeritorhiza haematococci]
MLAPGFCGHRYSKLNAARITAVNGLTPNMCNQCLEVSSASGNGPVQYILAIDKKVGEGLDVARTSFAAMFPGSNPLDPQTCRWR